MCRSESADGVTHMVRRPGHGEKTKLIRGHLLDLIKSASTHFDNWPRPLTWSLSIVGLNSALIVQAWWNRCFSMPDWVSSHSLEGMDDASCAMGVLCMSAAMPSCSRVMYEHCLAWPRCVMANRRHCVLEKALVVSQTSFEVLPSRP